MLGQKGAIFRQTAGKFPTEKIWVLNISFMSSNFPQMGDFQPQIWTLAKNFPTRIPFSNTAKIGGGVGNCPPLPRSHWWKCPSTVYDELWSSMSCDSSAGSLVSGDADGVITSSVAGSLTTHRSHVITQKNICAMSF